MSPLPSPAVAAQAATVERFRQLRVVPLATVRADDAQALATTSFASGFRAWR